MSFIERLESLLKENNVSQKQLSEDCKIGKNQFAYWKKNQNIPNGAIVAKIANYFDVSVDYLLGKTDEIKKAPVINDGGDEGYYLLANRGKDGAAIEQLSKEEYNALIAWIQTLRRNTNEEL